MDSFRIEMRVNARTRGLEMVWSSSGVTCREVPTGLREDQLPELRAALGRSLQRAKDALGSELNPSWKQINAAMQELWKAGNYLMVNLFPKNAPHVLQSWQECVDPHVNYSVEPQVITLVGPESEGLVGKAPNLLLPLEFLPLFRRPTRRPKPLPKIETPEALVEALGDFVGSRCIVSRVVASAGEQVPRPQADEVANRDRRRAAKLFICRTLPGALEEEQRLCSEHRGKLRFDVWPRKGAVGNAEKLAEFLWRTTHCTQGRRRPLPDVVHHFATHFDTRPEHADEHLITLAGCAATQFDVRMFDLEAELGGWRMNGQLPERDQRPLVFMNACGSSQIDPRGVTSLPDLFLGLLGSRGFIGTETTMSDSIAVEFATEFYARLLQGATVGRALHDARRALVAKFHNPLGLFYTSYVHPDLKLFPLQN